MTRLRCRRMAKSSKRYVPVKIEAEVVRQGRIVAAYREMDLNAYFSEVLAPIVRKHLDEHQQAESGCTPQPEQERGNSKKSRSGN